MPPISVEYVANLLDYKHVVSVLEQPEWRKERLRQHGPTGCVIDGYNDLSKCFLWEWNVQKLGPLTFDADRTLTFDGVNFMERRRGHPDDGLPPPPFVNDATFSVSLTRWLEKKVMARDHELLKDPKWRYRTLWHEYLRITEVISAIEFFIMTRLL